MGSVKIAQLDMSTTKMKSFNYLMILSVIVLSDMPSRTTAQIPTTEKIVFDKDIAAHFVFRYKPLWKNTGTPIKFRELLQNLRDDDVFLEDFIKLLRFGNPDAYYFECPAVNNDVADTMDFEFITYNARNNLDGGYYPRQPNRHTFSDHFGLCHDLNVKSVEFDSLGRDGTLISPCPPQNANEDGDYLHLAKFMKMDLEDNIDVIKSLWKKTAKTFLDKLRQTNKDLWLSTNGGGIAWLHVRLFSNPWYYTFSPYRASVSRRPRPTQQPTQRSTQQPIQQPTQQPIQITAEMPTQSSNQTNNIFGRVDCPIGCKNIRDRCICSSLVRNGIASSWDDAKSVCERRGGVLASIRDQEDHEAFESEFDGFGNGKIFFIGGTDKAIENQWKWLDGSAFSYNKWDPITEETNNGGEQQLEEDCILVKEHGKWWDIPCSMKIYRDSMCICQLI